MLSLKTSLLICFCMSLFFISSCKKDNPLDQGTLPAPLKLSAPSDLKIVSMTETEVVLTWKNNNSGEISFVVEQSTDSINYMPVKSVGPDTVTATIKGDFQTTLTYYFRVKAATADTSSAPSEAVKKTLFTPPTEMSIQSFSSSSVSLKWKDNSDNETGFYIEQSIDASPFTAIDSTVANTTSKTISGTFDSSKTYAFRIVAHSTTRRSGPSNSLARTLGNWVLVAGGTFWMGRNNGYPDESPVHQVTLSTYYIGKYEVTVKEYRQYTDAMKKSMPPAPPNGWNDDEPIVNVTWYDATAYCHWLDSTTGNKARMVTEAEWEFAARGGIHSQHYIYSGSNMRDEVAWDYFNGIGVCHRVGSKLPNELGIYDMSGNAWEWCADWNGSYSWTPVINPKGPLSSQNKVLRGGSWFDYGMGDSDCRVDARYAYTPDRCTSDGGFRVARTK